QCGINTNDLCVGLGVDEARVAIESVASDAGRVRLHLAIGLVQQDPDGEMKRMVSLAFEPVEEPLDARLVRDWRIGIGTFVWRLGRVFPTQAVDVKQLLSRLVVRLKRAVVERPSG